MFEDINEIKKYIIVSRNLDIKIIKPYLEEAIRVKIEPIIGKIDWRDNIITINGKRATPQISELLKKAIANYGVAYSIPFLKVHLSNTGGNYLTDAKTEKSPWWDLRDYGLSAISIADKSLNSAIDLLGEKALIIRTELPLLIRTVTEFEKYYSIGSNWELFVKIIPIMKQSWNIMVDELGECFTKITLKDNGYFINEKQLSNSIVDVLKNSLVLLTVSEIADIGNFSFSGQSIVMQWEDLPWQKNKLMSISGLNQLAEKLRKRYKLLINNLLAQLKKDNLLCKENQVREVITKKSGIYF